MPKSQALNHALILVAALGVIQLVRQQITLRQLAFERDRLSEKFGRFKVKDPSQIYVSSVHSDTPNEFMWRFYFPENISVQNQLLIKGHKTMRSFSPPLMIAVESFGQCYFEIKSDEIFFHSSSRGFAQHGSLGTGPINKFIQQHWEEMEFHVYAKTAPVSVASSNIVELLTVRVPIHLHDQMIDEVGESYLPFLAKPLMQWKMGTDEAFQAEEKALSMRTK